MNRWIMRLTVAACGAAFVLAGCGSPRRDAPIARDVPLDAPHLRAGRAVFYAHCNECHPHGEAGFGPALNNKPLPGWAIKLQVRRGIGSMPAFSKGRLPDEALQDLVAYLQALRKQKPSQADIH